MAKSEHRLAVDAAVRLVLETEANAPEPPPLDPDAPRAQTLAEQLAIFIAQCRADGDDEAFMTEVLLRSFDPKLAKQTLLEAALVMRSLRYDKVVPVLMKVARSAPSRERRMPFAPSHRRPV